MKSKFHPNSWSRVISASIAIFAVSCCNEWIVQLFVAAVIWMILAINGFTSETFKFLTRIWLPLALMLVTVWGFIVKAPPEKVVGSDPDGGLLYAVLIALRLASLSLIFQLVFLPLRGLRIAAFLAELRLPAAVVASTSSIFMLWPEFSTRADRIVAARCARGLMPNRCFWNRIKQLPYSIRTLFFGAIGQNLERAQNWQIERLPQRMVETALRQDTTGTPMGSTFYLLGAGTISLIVFLTRNA